MLQASCHNEVSPLPATKQMKRAVQTFFMQTAVLRTWGQPIPALFSSLNAYSYNTVKKVSDLCDSV